MHPYEQIQQSAAVWPVPQTAVLNGCAGFTAAWVRPREEGEVLVMQRYRGQRDKSRSSHVLRYYLQPITTILLFPRCSWCSHKSGTLLLFWQKIKSICSREDHAVRGVISLQEHKKKEQNNLYGIKGAIKIYVVPNITKNYWRNVNNVYSISNVRGREMSTNYSGDGSLIAICN